jgi:hypothetical protein
MTITRFPSSPTQMTDLHSFLQGIYDEFRRLELYNSSLLCFLARLREHGELYDHEYDYTIDSHEQHIFRDGPLPGDYTFEILEDDIRCGRVSRGYQLFLVDVCKGTNIWNNWRLVLEIV